MKQKTLIGIGVVVLTLGGLYWLAKTGSNEGNEVTSAGPVTQTSPLKASESSYNFGTISMAAGNVAHEFKVVNESSTPVTIRKVYTSCMCTTAHLIRGETKRGPFGMPGHAPVPEINEEIAPGEEITIEAIFDPTAHGPAGVGRNNRAIYLETDNGVTELQFTVFVQP